MYPQPTLPLKRHTNVHTNTHNVSHTDIYFSHSSCTVLGSIHPSVVHRHCQRFKPTFSRRPSLSAVQTNLHSPTATVSGSNQPSVVGLHCQRFKPTFSRPPSLSSVQTNLQSSAFTVLGSNQPSVVHRYCQRFKPTFSRRRGAARRVGLCGVGRLRPSQHRNATNDVATSQSRGNERTNDDERRRTTTNDDDVNI